MKITLALLICVGLLGCQTVVKHPPSTKQVSVTPANTQPKQIQTPSGVTITPYSQDEIKRQSVSP